MAGIRDPISISENGEVNLAGLSLTEVPETLRGPRLAASVRVLKVRANPIMKLPEWLPELPNVNHLDFAECQITGLPESLAKLVDLRQLDLDKNPISEFPSVLRKIPGIQVLNLDLCRIAVLPEWIGEMQELEWLYLRGNPVKSLPRSITHLPKLRFLRFPGNPESDVDEATTREDVRSRLLSYHTQHYQKNLRGLNACVIGNGSPDIPEAQKRAARLVGRMLAQAGARLTVGTYAGVDESAAAAYEDAMSSLDDETRLASTGITILRGGEGIGETLSAFWKRLTEREPERPGLVQRVERRVTGQPAADGVIDDWFTNVDVVIEIPGGLRMARAYAEAARSRLGKPVLCLEWPDA